MSLKSFIAGEGPYYRLTGDAPARAGQALVSVGDGTAVWSDVSGGSAAGEWTLSQAAIGAGGISSGLVPIWTGVTTVTSASGLQPGLFKRIQVMVENTTTFREVRDAEEFIITIPGITAAANDTDLFGSCEVALNDLDGTLYTTIWYLDGGTTELKIEVPTGGDTPSATTMKLNGWSFWYLGKN